MHHLPQVFLPRPGGTLFYGLPFSLEKKISSDRSYDPNIQIIIQFGQNIGCYMIWSKRLPRVGTPQEDSCHKENEAWAGRRCYGAKALFDGHY